MQLPRVLLFVALKRAELAPLVAAEPPFRLQLLQAILLRSLRRLRLQIIPLRILPLAALERAQFAPVSAAQPALRLQLLQTRILDGLLLRRNGDGARNPPRSSSLRSSSGGRKGNGQMAVGCRGS